MKIAKKQQYVLDILCAIRDFIWIEDLYLQLRKKGVAISSRTVHDTIWYLNRLGAIVLRSEGRKTYVKMISDKI
jgi:Fe2+ or Zn2+ uptake regulation protein